MVPYTTSFFWKLMVPSTTSFRWMVVYHTISTTLSLFLCNGDGTSYHLALGASVLLNRPWREDSFVSSQMLKKRHLSLFVLDRLLRQRAKPIGCVFVSSAIKNGQL
jgi:hypothetical protein